MRPRFTFAVVGRNEAERLAGMVGQAQLAAQDDDRVWFVDSASGDHSIAVARALGVDDVIEGSEGKGRAMEAALDRCESGYICFLDGDLERWAVNIPATLRAATLRSGAAMVVGVFDEDRRRMVVPFLYWPLVDSLFPEYGRLCDPKPLSGLRVIDAALVRRPLPPGYGVETYLNLTLADDGHTIVTEHLGFVGNPLRAYGNVQESALAIVTEILDFAVERGRLDPGLRPQWTRWVRHVLDTIGVPPVPGAPAEDHLAAIAEASARPLPPAHGVRA